MVFMTKHLFLPSPHPPPLPPHQRWLKASYLLLLRKILLQRALLGLLPFQHPRLLKRRLTLIIEQVAQEFPSELLFLSQKREKKYQQVHQLAMTVTLIAAAVAMDKAHLDLHLQQALRLLFHHHQLLLLY